MLRDYLHDAWGGARSNLFALIAAGGALTYAINADAGRIALASSVAFAAAALIDWAVYSIAKRWTWLARSNASNVREAKRRGKHVHMGRVNSMQRIGYAKAIGCDSVDGTGWAKWRDAMMPKGVRALDQQVMETGV